MFIKMSYLQADKKKRVTVLFQSSHAFVASKSSKALNKWPQAMQKTSNTLTISLSHDKEKGIQTHICRSLFNYIVSKLGQIIWYLSIISPLLYHLYYITFIISPLLYHLYYITFIISPLFSDWSIFHASKLYYFFLCCMSVKIFTNFFRLHWTSAIKAKIFRSSRFLDATITTSWHLTHKLPNLLWAQISGEETELFLTW